MPTFRDGDVVINESNAVCLYLEVSDCLTSLWGNHFLWTSAESSCALILVQANMLANSELTSYYFHHETGRLQCNDKFMTFSPHKIGLDSSHESPPYFPEKIGFNTSHDLSHCFVAVVALFCFSCKQFTYNVKLYFLRKKRKRKPSLIFKISALMVE